MKRWFQRLAHVWAIDEPRRLSAQMELLDRNFPMALVSSSLVAVLAAVAYWLSTGNRAVLWWALLAVVVSALGQVVLRAQPSPSEVSQARGYERFAQRMALLLGMVWGLFVWWFMKPNEPATVTIVMGIMAGMSAGGLVALAPSWSVSVAYGLACLMPSAWVLLHGDGVVNLSLGLAAVTYLCVMGWFSFRAAEVTLRSIDLRLENAALVVRLRDQTNRAFEARQMAEEAMREAEEANRAKSVFLAAASHDLRQPLHALGLFLTALGHTALNGHQRQLLGHVEASSEAASEMLNTLLDFSKVDAGVVTPRPRPLVLQALLHKLEREFAPQAIAKGLVFRLRDTPLVLHADAQLLELILRNLVANAIRYTEDGGVLMACRRRGERAVIEVWDTGVGIPGTQYRAIFQEFHQLGNPERDRKNGLGLGLAIVDGLARAMSVEVSLASRVGRGSVFRVTLPLSQVAVLEDSVLPVMEADLAGARVLLIDDDETVRVAMAELLTAWGCWCEVVASAQEAMGLLSGFTPEVILADYRLRDHQTGRDAIELVRKRVGQPVPAVIITGDTAADRLREAGSSGVTLLHKPVASAQLQRALAQALQRDQAGARSR